MAKPWDKKEPASAPEPRTEKGEWETKLEVMLNRIDVAEKFRAGITLTPDATAALGRILRDMAQKLDSHIKLLDDALKSD